MMAEVSERLARAASVTVGASDLAAGVRAAELAGLDRCGDRRGFPMPIRREHGVEQPWETLLQVHAPKRQVAPAPVWPAAHHAGFAQHSQVVRSGGLRHFELEAPARALALALEVADYRQARRVAER